MIDSARTASSDISLVGFRIFAQVVQPAGQRCGLRGAELVREHFGTQRGLLQMVPQGLPIGTVRSCR